jgi:hypothetical protein
LIVIVILPVHPCHVIPGRTEGANPESITPVYPIKHHRGYGFRIAAARRPE